MAIVRPAEGDAITLLNPVVVEESSGTDEQFEGCLSFLDIRGEVPRPRMPGVRHQDFDGRGQTASFSDGLARLVAHEVDHPDRVPYVARGPAGVGAGGPGRGLDVAQGVPGAAAEQVGGERLGARSPMPVGA
ncbi:peptide deformylase [Streptomyces sp. NPDC001732]